MTTHDSTPEPVVTGTATNASAPDGRFPQDPRPVSTSVRVGTIVWGLVITLVGVIVLAVALGARIDLQLALIVVLCIAGVALVAGSIATAIRHRR